MKIVVRRIFAALTRTNRLFLPKYSGRDLNNLRSLDRIIIAWKIWVTKNSL